jgi:hypothetical protein
MVHRHTLLLSFVLTLACAKPQATSLHRHSDPTGDWVLIFFRPKDEPRRSADSILGTLTLRPFEDSDTARVWFIRQIRPGTLVGVASLDFTPILGRQISCYFEESQDLNSDTGPPLRVSPSIPLGLPGAQDSLWLDFTPGAADCGLHVNAHLNGRVGTGRWTEPSFAGNGRSGRFRMVRRD